MRGRPLQVFDASGSAFERLLDRGVCGLQVATVIASVGERRSSLSVARSQDGESDGSDPSPAASACQAYHADISKGGVSHFFSLRRSLWRELSRLPDGQP